MRYLKRWQLAIVCLIMLALLPVIPVRRGQTQAVTYTITDLGTLGGTQSFAYGLNNCGRVVGRSSVAGSDGNFHPFVWSDGQFTDIAPNIDNGTANAINELGFAAGAISGAHAFIWSAASGRQDIGALPGGTSASAFGINDNNLVVGVSEVDLFNIRGFVWQQSTGMQVIGTFGGSSSTAYAVNNSGTVVGSAQTASGPSHAYTLSGGVMSDLLTLGGSSSIAFGINDGGEVVGSSDVSSTSLQPYHAFIWSSTTGMLDMGTLAGGTRSVAEDINNAGQAVGYAEVPTGQHAFIYTRTNGMSDLNDLVPAGSGWTLNDAEAINERGQIAGVGISPSDPDHQHALLLTPDNAGPSPCSQAGSLQFDSAAYSVSESGIKKTITVTRTGGFGGAVSVNYAASDGTATTAGSDYQATSGTLNFAEGETSKTFDVNVNDDAIFEANESVNLTLSNPQGSATLGAQSTAVLTINDNDAAPSFAIGDVTQAEGNAGTSSFTFTVTKSGLTELPASVQFATADGTATTADGDYIATSGTLNFAASEPTKQIVVTVNGDSNVEANETFNVNLSNPSNATISDNQAIGTITNDDSLPVGAFQFSAATYSVGEGSGTATITVTRTNGSDGAASINFATSNSNGTAATAGLDYTATSGTLNFTNGETSKTFPVVIADDTLDEADETVNLTLSNPTNGAAFGAQTTAVLTINDNDAQPTLQFNPATYSVGEGGGMATITVVRAGGSNAVSVGYATSNGTATAGQDYTATNGTLNFAEGETQKTFTVAISDDTLDEPDNEIVNLTLSNTTGGAALGAQTTAVLTINDNDSTPSISVNDVSLAEGDTGTQNAAFTVTLSTASAQNVSVHVATADSSATAGSDYNAVSDVTISIPAGSTFATFNIAVRGDVVFEAGETFTVNLSNSTNAAIADGQGVGTITNDDSAPTLSINDVTQAEGNAGTSSFTFTVTKSGLTELPASVQFATADGTATTADGDYIATSGTLNFAASEPTKQIVVTVNGDSKFESAEDFFVNLTNPSGATIAGGQSKGTITNDDAAPVAGAFQFGAAAYSVGEGGGTATITVTRTGGSDGTVSVKYATAGGTATAGLDYTDTSDTLIFANGETSKTFAVAINDDTLNEADETINLMLSNPTNGATLVTPSTAVLTITNDDTPRVQFSASAFAADESQNLRVITVTRTGDPSIPVTVDYVTSDGTASQRNDYTFAYGTLRFAAGETSKSFDLPLTDDAFQEADETINLTLSNPTGGAALGVQSTATVTIAANDNPPPGPNPIDDSAFFVRMQYHDFLGRKPDDSGLGFWINNITSCGSNAQCRESQRVNTSAAFFLSIEFQNTGYLVERMYKVAYGDANGITRITGTPVQIPVPIVRRSEFLVDSAIIRDGVIVNVGNWEQMLENNKNAFALAFVQRQRFVGVYPTSLTPAAFVQKLNQNTGNALTQAEANALVAEFGGAADTSDIAKRASVFRKVAENAEVDRREQNRAFVLMQFFGYLQRDPDAAPDTDHTGWKFWLDKLDQFNGDFRQAEMVKAFISSIEYRQRFGQ